MRDRLAAVSFFLPRFVSPRRLYPRPFGTPRKSGFRPLALIPPYPWKVGCVPTYRFTWLMSVPLPREDCRPGA
jgi:hypothetical protein